MTPKTDPSNPQAWLRHARSNLHLAERGKRLKGVLLEDLCFNAQQAAEKAGISVSYLSQLETSERKGSLDVLSAIAKALKVSLENIVPSQP